MRPGESSSAQLVDAHVEHGNSNHHSLHAFVCKIIVTLVWTLRKMSPGALFKFPKLN